METNKPTVRYWTLYNENLDEIQVPDYSEFYTYYGQYWDPKIFPQDLPGYVPPEDNSQKVPLNRYFLTFTRDPSNGSKLDWYSMLKKALRQSIHTFVTATIEHPSTNIHCHAVVETKYNLWKGSYKAFTKHHHIDIKKLKWDNGVKSYMSKENEAIDSVDKFIAFWDPIIEKIN